MTAADRLGLISLDFDDPLDCVAACRRRGLRYMELFVLSAADDPVVHQALDLHRRGEVQVHSVSTLAKLAQAEDGELDRHLAWVHRALDLAERYGVPHVGFMYGGCDTLSPVDARDRFLERMAPIAERARAAGIGLLVENVFSRQPPGDLEDVASTLELFDAVDRDVVGLSFDPGNYAIAGEEAWPFAYEQLRPVIRNVHLKDVTRHRPQVHGPDPECRPLVEHRRGRHVTVPLGEGMLNATRLVEALVADGGDHPLLLEPFRSGVSRERWLDASLAWLAPIVGGGPHGHG